jgi:hypothetical protein
MTTNNQPGALVKRKPTYEILNATPSQLFNLANVLPNQIAKNQYTMSGGQTSRPYTFYIPDNESIAVYETPAGQEPNPNLDILVLDVDYTVTGAENPTGGTVIFAVTPAVGNVVTLIRNVPYAIDTQFSETINFSGSNLDNELENLVLQTQQLNTAIQSQCIQYAVNQLVTSGTPSPQTIVPILTNVDRQVWMSQGGEIIAAELTCDDPGCSTLRSELAQDSSYASAGAALVGYYDQSTDTPMTVNSMLARLDNQANLYRFKSGMNTGSIDGTSIFITAGAVNLAQTPLNSFLTVGSNGMSKLFATTWAPGSGNGGAFTSVGSPGWYYIFCIYNPATGSVDFGIDNNPQCSNRPAEYVYFRRIGVVFGLSGLAKYFTITDGLFSGDLSVGSYASLIYGAQNYPAQAETTNVVYTGTYASIASATMGIPAINIILQATINTKGQGSAPGVGGRIRTIAANPGTASPYPIAYGVSFAESLTGIQYFNETTQVDIPVERSAQSFNLLGNIISAPPAGTVNFTYTLTAYSFIDLFAN